MHTRYAKLAGALLSAFVAAACGNGPELVDRTQPNYIKKSDLTQGTWYVQDTVVGVPPTTAITFEGETTPVDKIRFEVQENYLVAYRTYEFLPGSEPSVDREKSTIGNVVTVDGKPYRGAPIAAWKIESHFDRVREYNAATGEQSNVLEENTKDRPWYERDFIRVNWGANSISNWNMWTSNTESFMNTFVQPIDMEKGDDAFVTDYGDDETLDYFDFTVRSYWEPMGFDYPGYGTIPYCWLNPSVDCRAAMIKVRSSFKRVDEKHVADYEPLKYDDRMMKKFGYFRLGWNYSLERPTYDPDRGSTLSGRLLYAIRHNIWERAHNDDGSVIPVEQRQPKPVVYYLSDNYPADLMESARKLEASWDKAFRKAVAVPRGLQVADVPQMFYICENPVPAGAPAACGREGLHVRMGDIRYHMFNWVDQPQMAGPLGYGPSGVDPETGEIIHAVANMYGAGVDQLAGSTLQLLDVMNGDISLDQLVAGSDVRDFLKANRSPTDPRRPSGPAQSKGGLTNDATQKGAAFAALTPELRSKMLTYKASGTMPLRKENRRAVVNQLIQKNAELENELINAPEVRGAVLAAAPGETWRQKLQTDPAFYRQVARETMLRMDEFERIWKMREDAASRKNLWLAEFSDGAYIYLAKDIKAVYDQKLAEYQAAGKSLVEAKTLAKTDAWNRIRNGLNQFIGEHEVGHTLGLMHNFSATFDAMNYQDGYWDLRKSTIGVMAGGKRVLPLTPQDLLDASRPTEEQLSKGMPSLQYSSVMDYTARFPNHAHGIGKYDEAAILFGYSGGAEPGWVEVFNQTRADVEGPHAYADPHQKLETTNLAKPLMVRGAHAEIPLTMVEHWTPASPMYSDRFHYTTLPFHFADKVSDGTFEFEQALDQGLERMKSRSYRKWSEMKVVYDTIEFFLNEYNVNGDYLTGDDYDRSRHVIGKVAELRRGAGQDLPVEVPYMYCSDIEVGANLACNRYDSGADYFEMTRDWIERYNEYYVFSNFRRDRVAGWAFFNPQRVLSSKFARYTSNLPNVYQHWLFNIYWYQFYYDLSTQEMEQYLGTADPMTQNYWTMAVIDGVNHILGELSTPSAGYHGKDAVTGRWVHLKQNNTQNTRLSSAEEQALKDALTSGADAPYTEVVYVPRGPGRSMYTLYDNQGYNFQGRVEEVGHFWDQYGAMIALTASETNFLGVDRGSDALRYSLPYYMTFPKELSKAVSSVWLQDSAPISSELVKTTEGLATVRQPAFIRAENYVAGFVYPPKPTDAQPVTGTPEVVEPSIPWSTRFYAQLFGMAYFTENFNMDFAAQNQVFRLGSGENVTPASGHEVVTFDDPFGGGYTYAAVQKIGETNPQAAAHMVRRAALLKSEWDYKKQEAAAATDPVEKAKWEKLAAEYEGKTRDAVRNLEMMRGLYSIFGQTW